MQRIDVVRTLAPLVTPEDLVAHASGILDADWWNCLPSGIDNGFTPGGMGSNLSTALGLALALPHRRIICLETDGSLLLSTSILCTLGAERPPNLTVIVFDNGAYESIGAPLTLTSMNTDLARMAEGAGCINCVTARDLEAFSREARRLLTDGECGFLVAKIELGVYSWPKEKRKNMDNVEEKYRFIRYVERLEGIDVHSVDA
ncbi:MAG: hypothetical protein HY675_12930 [Chloroflexi bacterium]|nr:hypothetical protein [Chloroflexota bacterium]